MDENAIKSLQESSRNRLFHIIAAGALYSFLFVNGMLGINFGYHWDEWFFINAATDFFSDGRILPKFYHYPSFCYSLTLVNGLFYSLFHDCTNHFSFLGSTGFTLFNRAVFVSISSLIVIWVYFIALKATRSRFYAIIAGLFICSSFEIGYHSRWAVSDMITVQFAAMSIMMLFLDIKPFKRVLLSAACAGLTAGTKYPGVIVVINIAVFIVTEFLRHRNSPGQTVMLLKTIAGAAGAFSLAFIVTTPGCIVETRKFIADILVMNNAYLADHMGYTVRPGISHSAKIALWIVFTAFSKVHLLSAGVTGLGLFGVFAAWRKKDWKVLALILFLASYILFMSHYSIMVSRNLLYAVPVLAVLSSFGLYHFHQTVKRKSVVIAVHGAVLLALLLSMNEVASASVSIYRKNSIDMKKELHTYLRRHKNRSFVVSDTLQRMLQFPGRGQTTKDCYLVFLKNEVDYRHIQSNRFMMYEQVGGPRDVNINYYPTWSGQDRVMIMKYSGANKRNLRDLGLD